VYASFGLFTIVLAAVYALRLLQGTMHGPYRLPADVPQPKDLRPRELALVAPLLAAIFFFGIWPAWLNDRVPEPSASTSQLVRPTAEHRS
jgi:NADH-quinone oxidoreductase subunit M